MIYINTTGKQNQVWLPKPYDIVIDDCPDVEDAYNSGYTSGYTDGVEDGYDSGYTSGKTDGIAEQKEKLVATAITANGTYSRPDGYSSISVNVPQTGQSVNNQEKWITFNTNPANYNLTWMPSLQAYVTNTPVRVSADSGYTGIEPAVVDIYQPATEAIALGMQNQKAKMVATAITANGTYTRPDGWSSVTINVSGYSQADLDAAYASGYSAGLADCSGYTPVTGYSTLDLTYETSAINQTISLFHGDAGDASENRWFRLFFSALTAIEIDGVEETPDASNIITKNSISSYTHTFATAGKHRVKYYVSSGYTDPLGTDPAKMIKVLLFSQYLDSNLNNSCPIVEANIGEGYEVLYFGAFADQTGLTGLTLPDTLTTLCGYPFENVAILDVTIPASVTEIGHKSFYSCSALTAMTFEGLTPPTLSGTDPLGQTAYTFPIYVPASVVSIYQSEPSWVNYASRVQAKP